MLMVIQLRCSYLDSKATGTNKQGIKRGPPNRAVIISKAINRRNSEQRGYWGWKS